MSDETKREIDYDTIDAGVRDVVRMLNERGWRTTDSGDGTKAPRMECAFPYPNVAVRLDDPAALARAAHELTDVLREIDPARPWRVEASYVPGEPAILLALAHDPYEADRRANALPDNVSDEDFPAVLRTVKEVLENVGEYGRSFTFAITDHDVAHQDHFRTMLHTWAKKLVAMTGKATIGDAPAFQTVDWVNCPVCDGTDMRKWSDGEQTYIECVNGACASNGGDNASALSVTRERDEAGANLKAMHVAHAVAVRERDEARAANEEARGLLAGSNAAWEGCRAQRDATRATLARLVGAVEQHVASWVRPEVAAWPGVDDSGHLGILTFGQARPILAALEAAKHTPTSTCVQEAKKGPLADPPGLLAAVKKIEPWLVAVTTQLTFADDAFLHAVVMETGRVGIRVDDARALLDAANQPPTDVAHLRKLVEAGGRWSLLAIALQKQLSAEEGLRAYLLSWQGKPEAIIRAKDDAEAEKIVYGHHLRNVERGTVRNWSWRAMPVYRP